MVLRIAAILGGLGPALVPFVMPGGAEASLALAGSLAALTLVVLLRTRRRELAGIGLALAVVAGIVAPSAYDLLPLTGLGAGVPTVDLELEAFPDPSPPYATVRGYYRDQWTLDEYATPQGQRPDQSTAADAVLVPFVGTTEDVVQLAGAVVVARVAGNAPRSEQATTVTGRVTPLADEALGALVAVVRPVDSGASGDGGVHGVVIDTLDAPQRGEAWTRLLLLGALALGALGCLLVAAGSPRPK